MRRSHGWPAARSSGPVTPSASSSSWPSGRDVAQALQDDLVLGQQVAVGVDAVGHDLAEGAHALGEAGRDVLDHAADLDVARVHALARGHLEQVEDRLALAEAVPEHRDRAEVQRARAQPHQVAHDPVELEVHHAQVLRALGDLDADERLDGPAVGHRVEVVGEVVHPLDDGDDLPVALVLGRLLDAGVDVADDRLEVAHDLALEVTSSRSTPCVAGWCGPKLMVRSSCSMPSPRRHAWRGAVTSSASSWRRYSETSVMPCSPARRPRPW